MPFGDVPSLSNYTGRMAAADRYYDPNEFNESRENYRQNQYRRASFDALMRRLEPPDMQLQRKRVADVEAANDALTDLRVFKPEMERRTGDIKRDESMLNARAAQREFFAQTPMREAQEAESLRALQRRYTDPALVRAEAQIEAARERARADRDVATTRGRTATDVAGITAGSRERTAATNQYGGVARERVLTGDAAAGPEASQELGTRMGPPERTMTIGGPEGLQRYADEHGITLEQAIRFAESQGYVVVD